ncbi:hypothetical protein BJY04DRAFT_192810 [Aspergillus karnatakaensis]|uniref:uncharacterized protein n=1 Tax=Aspergillus karnatakaensis TaxID=1810916 RepID=UPI003CCE009F
MLLSRYRNDDEDKNGLEKRKGGRGGGGKGGKGMKSDPEDIATACAAFALICFFFYLCSTVYMCRLVYGRLVRSRADRKEMQQAGDASRVTAAGEDVC